MTPEELSAGLRDGGFALLMSDAPGGLTAWRLTAPAIEPDEPALRWWDWLRVQPPRAGPIPGPVWTGVAESDEDAMRAAYETAIGPVVVMVQDA